MQHVCVNFTNNQGVRNQNFNKVIYSEKGLVRELEIESGCIRYDMAPQPPHSHFVCRNCGRIADMPMPEGIAAIIMPEYSVDCVDVFLKGFCPDCRKLKSQPITNISTI